MPKVKIPNRVREHAADLEIDLEGQAGFTSDPEALIIFFKHVNESLRTEENEHRDDIDRELDELEAEMLEAADDHQ